MSRKSFAGQNDISPEPSQLSSVISFEVFSRSGQIRKIDYIEYSAGKRLFDSIAEDFKSNGSLSYQVSDASKGKTIHFGKRNGHKNQRTDARAELSELNHRKFDE